MYVIRDVCVTSQPKIICYLCYCIDITDIYLMSQLELCISLHVIYIITDIINPYLAKLIYLNFHPLEVVSRYRDPQLQVE